MRRAIESSLTEISEHISYNPATGVFVRIKSSGTVRAGAVAGTVKKNGYLQISVNKRLYLAHRLAFALHYGRWPTLTIDHINMIKTDNRICNLREATDSQNQINRTRNSDNTTGYKGVTKHRGKYVARASINNKQKYLGTFSTPELAHAAYSQDVIGRQGEFART